MKQKIVLYLLFAAIIAAGCSSRRKKMEDLPFIDIKKNYLEKELRMTDFANVSYIYLSSVNTDYLYKGLINNMYITKNTIVVCDNGSSSILFFSKDGHPKSRFNRLGLGPKEYINVTRILYDEDTDDVFVSSDYVDYIQVYSSKGEYKRRISLPQYAKVHSLISSDNQSLWMFADKYYKYIIPDAREKNKANTSYYITYYRISKKNGEVLDSINLHTNGVSLISTDSKLNAYQLLNYYRLTKGEDGFFFCNPEIDTVFLYTKNKSLTPVFCKIPSADNLDPLTVLENVVDASRYQFFCISTIQGVGDYPRKFYFRDKKTNEIFLQKIILPDYKGKEFHILAAGAKVACEDENDYVYELNLIELKQANKENRLSGKLKDLVDQLNELEDNNIFMLVHFK